MKRGEIYYANLNPTRGSEQAGQRPVLIYQHNRQIQAGRTVVIIPFTTNLRRQRLPSCQFIPAGEGGLTQDSVALCHQLRAIDKSRVIGNCLGSLSAKWMAAIDQVVLSTLDIKSGS